MHFVGFYLLARNAFSLFFYWFSMKKNCIHCGFELPSRYSSLCPSCKAFPDEHLDLKKAFISPEKADLQRTFELSPIDIESKSRTTFTNYQPKQSNDREVAFMVDNYASKRRSARVTKTQKKSNVSVFSKVIVIATALTASAYVVANVVRFAV